jgi:ribonuclease D
LFDLTPLIHVRDADALADAVAKLSEAPVIGIDTESDSFYSYQEKVCLIQLSDLEQDYVIDPLKVKDLSTLAPLMADPNVVKILHGADYDIVCLRRDFDFQFHNVFDTLIASQLLGFPRIGLADLIQRFFGHVIDKQYQRYDWSRRPLKPEHIDYARGDTHFLLALREILTRKLKSAGRMRHMQEECELVSKREWQGRKFDEDGFLHMKQVHTLDSDGLKVLRRLWLYRDDCARKQNRPVFKVIPDQVLVSIADARPLDSRAFDALMPGKAAMKRRYGSGLVQAVLDGIDDEVVPVPPKGRGGKKKKKKRSSNVRPRLRGRQAERALIELKAWRNRTIESQRLSPFTTASNGVLQAIASARPRDLTELAALPEVRNWQVQDFGSSILEVLDEVDPA